MHIMIFKFWFGLLNTRHKIGIQVSPTPVTKFKSSSRHSSNQLLIMSLSFHNVHVNKHDDQCSAPDT